MTGAYKVIKRIYDNIATVVFSVLVFCVVLQIFARYILAIAFPWTEELARHLLIICCFLGAVATFRTGGHLGAFFLRDAAKGRFRGFIYTVNSFIVLFALVLLFYGAMRMRFMVAGLDSSTMGWFMQSWLYDAAVLGFGLMFCFGLRDLYRSILVMLGRKEITLTGKSCPFPEEI